MDEMRCSHDQLYGPEWFPGVHLESRNFLSGMELATWCTTVCRAVRSDWVRFGWMPDRRIELIIMESDSENSIAQRQSEFLRFYAVDVERIRAYVSTLVPNRADGEDLFQKTSMVLWEKFESFDQSRSFFHWSCGVAFHLMLNHRRVKGRDRLVFNDDVLKAVAAVHLKTVAEQPSRQQALNDCVRKLSDKENELIKQRYEQNGSVKEMADRTGRPAKALYCQLEIIRKNLHKCVEGALRAQNVGRDV